MPRPKSRNARTRQLNISVSEAEYAAIIRRADSFGVKPVEFGRAAMLDERYMPGSLADQPTRAQQVMLLELRRIGNNLNQLTRLAHRHGVTPSEELTALLADIRQLLARALRE